MTYFHGLGDDTAWCSATNPKTGCANIAGVCVPVDKATLDLFILIQRTANALLAASSGKLLDVDGRIGPATLKAVNAFMPGGVEFASCDTMALSGGQVAASLMSLKQENQIPDVGDPPPKSPPTVFAGGAVVNPPPSVIAASAASQAGGILEIIKTPVGMAALAIGGLLVYQVTKKKRRR